MSGAPLDPCPPAARQASAPLTDPMALVNDSVLPPAPVPPRAPAPISESMTSAHSLAALTPAFLSSPDPAPPDDLASDDVEPLPAVLRDGRGGCRLPPPWPRAVPSHLRPQVRRLPVVGDGTCADGAIVQAVEQSDLLDSLPLSQSLSRGVSGKDAFRACVVGSGVSQWTVDDWTDKIPACFRDEERAELCRIRRRAHGGPQPYQPAAVTPTEELEFFQHVLSLPSHPVGNAYLHTAAGALQQGILLLSVDKRYKPPLCRLDDFGTLQYESSIILLFTVSPMAFVPGCRGDGHYDTVCLFPPEGGPAHTVFEMNHPLLCGIRHWAAQHASDRTLEHERVGEMYYHPAISMSPSAAFNGLPAPSSDVPSASHGPAGGGATGTRPRRLRVPSVRLRDLSTSGTSDAARERGGASRPVRCVSAGARPARASPAPDLPLPEQGASLSSCTALPPGVPGSRSASVQAAPLVAPSARAATLAADLPGNLRAWVRKNSRRGRLASRVHITAVPMWTVRCRTVLQSLAGALVALPMDEQKVLRLLCVLWMLPQEVFTVPGRTRGGKAGRKLRHHRIHHLLNDASLLGRLAESAEECVGPAGGHHGASGSAPLPEGPSDGDAVRVPPRSASSDGSGGVPVALSTRADRDAGTDVSAADRAAALRAEHLLRLGHVPRALRALTSTIGKADLDDASERATLRALHPSGPAELPQCPSDAPELVVDPSWMADEMSRSDTGAAPGPSGYGSNFIQVLATDTACVAAMAVLIGHIVNNKLPPAVRDLLNTCILVSLDKGGGGRRPVAMGDMFYRMAARVALSLVLDPAQRTLRPHQFAVGAEDGCTQVVQSLQHLLSLPPTPPPLGPRPPHQFAFPRPEGAVPRPAPAPVDRTPRPLACLSIDIVNAFNSVNRAAVLRAVYGNGELAACWRAVAFGYGHPSLLLLPCAADVPVGEAFIESSNGVRQGDPLAALLFCLVMHPVYARVAQVCRSGCFAFSDDGHAVGWLEECWKAWQLLPALLEPLGLRVNPAKCELTCFHTDALRHPADVEALEAFRSAGVVVNTTALKVLGCVVGANDAAMATELRTRPGFRARQRVAFRRLPLMRTQCAYLALSELTGTVLTHRLRAMPPAATQEHAVEYDCEMLRIAHSLVGVREVDRDRYDEQLRWPTADGGFGLHSAEHIASAAYLAGAECTLRSSPVFTTVWSGADWLEPAWPITVGIEDALRRVAAVEADLRARCTPAALAGVAASILPARAAAFVAHFKAFPPSPIQHAIVHRISTLSHIARMTAARAGGVQAKEEVARLQALKEKESSRWLRVRPTDTDLGMSNLQWQVSAQLRLGMPRAPHGAAAPPCCHVVAAATDGWHALVCQERSSAAVTARHHAVVRLLKFAADLIHVPAKTEPHDLCADAALRPDIQLHLPEYTLLSDVTISHPCAARWRNVAASRGVEVVGDARDSEKTEKYKDLTEALDAEFTSFVLYTFGGWHASALSVVNQLGAAADPAVALVSLSAWKEDIKNRIAVCVQRGTADIVLEDARHARMAEIARRLRGAAFRKASRKAAVRARRSLGPPSGSPPLAASMVPESPEQPLVPATPAFEPEINDMSDASVGGAVDPVVRALHAGADGPGRPVSATIVDCVPGTPGMDDVLAEPCVRSMSGLCISPCDYRAEARADGVVVAAFSGGSAARAVLDCCV